MLLGFSFVMTGLVALFHLIFAIAEMFFWKVIGPGLLGTTKPEAIKLTKPLMFNQGFYNLLIVAGLGWALIVGSESIAISFLLFVIVAGIVGAATVLTRIFYLQSVPAIIALAVILLS